MNCVRRNSITSRRQFIDSIHGSRSLHQSAMRNTSRYGAVLFGRKISTPRDALQALQSIDNKVMSDNDKKHLGDEMSKIIPTAWSGTDIFKLTQTFSSISCVVPPIFEATFIKKVQHFPFDQPNSIALVIPAIYRNTAMLQSLIRQFEKNNIPVTVSWNTMMNILVRVPAEQSREFENDIKEYLINVFIKYIREMKSHHQQSSDLTEIIEINTVAVSKHDFIQTAAISNISLLPSEWCRGLICSIVNCGRHIEQLTVRKLFLRLRPDDVTIGVAIAAFKLLDKSDDSLLLDSLLSSLSQITLRHKQLCKLLPYFASRRVINVRIATILLARSEMQFYGKNLPSGVVAQFLAIAGYHPVEKFLLNKLKMTRNRVWNNEDYLLFVRACNGIDIKIPKFATIMLKTFADKLTDGRADVIFIVSLAHELVISKRRYLVQRFVNFLFPIKYQQLPFEYFAKLLSALSLGEEKQRSEVVKWVENEISKKSKLSDGEFATFDSLLLELLRWGRIKNLLKKITSKEIAKSSPEQCSQILTSMVAQKVADDNVADLISNHLREVLSEVPRDVIGKCLVNLATLSFRCRPLYQESLPIFVSQKDINPEMGSKVLWSYSQQRETSSTCRKNLTTISNYLGTKLSDMSMSSISKAVIASASLSLVESSIIDDSEDYLSNNIQRAQYVNSTVLTQLISCYANNRLCSAAPQLCEILEKSNDMPPPVIGSYFMSCRLLNYEVSEHQLELLKVIVPALSSNPKGKLRNPHFDKMDAGDLCAILSVITERQVDPLTVNVFFSAASDYICQRHVVRSLKPRVSVLLLEAGARWLFGSKTLFNTIGRSLADSPAVTQMLNRELVSLLESYGKVSLRSPRLHAQICVRLSISRDLQSTELQRCVWGASSLGLVNTPQADSFWKTMRTHAANTAAELTEEENNAIQSSFKKIDGLTDT